MDVMGTLVMLAAVAAAAIGLGIWRSIVAHRRRKRGQLRFHKRLAS